MGMPSDLGIIDTMVGFPSPDRSQVYKFIQPHLRDEESKSFTMPAAYMFKDIPPEIDPEADPLSPPPPSVRVHPGVTIPPDL